MGVNHDLAHPHELSEARQQALDQGRLVGMPAARLDGIDGGPGNVCADRAVETHQHAVATAVDRPVLVVRPRGLQFLFIEEAGDVYRLAVGRAVS